MTNFSLEVLYPKNSYTRVFTASLALKESKTRRKRDFEKVSIESVQEEHPRSRICDGCLSLHVQKK